MSLFEFLGAISPVLSITISILISISIYLSYPLQLYPALQVLEIYCGYTHNVTPAPTTAAAEPIELEEVVENVLNPKILKRLNVVTDSPIYKRNPIEVLVSLLHSLLLTFVCRRSHYFALFSRCECQVELLQLVPRRPV